MGIGNAWPILRCQGPHSWYETYDIPGRGSVWLD